MPKKKTTKATPKKGETKSSTPPKSQEHSAPKLLSPWFLVSIGVLILSFSAGIAYTVQEFVMQQYTTPRAATGTSTDAASNEVVPISTQTKRVKFPQYNFSMNMFESWDEVRPSRIDVPHVTATPLYGYKRAMTDCYLTYAEVQQLGGQSAQYRTLHTAADDTITMSRRMPLDRVPENFAYRASTTPYLPGEMGTALYEPYTNNSVVDEEDRYAWILFTQTDEPVQKVCEQEYLSMLESLMPFFEEEELNMEDTGTLTIAQRPHDGAQLLFREKDHTVLVRTLDEGRIYKPTVVDTTLYYVGGTGQLKQYDISTGAEATIVPLALPEDASVNDFYFHENRLFALIGPWCQTYMAECDLTLVAYDMDKEETTTLATGLQGRMILGYSTELDALYFLYREGDAGMLWGSVSRYDFQTETMETRYDFSVDVAGDESAYAEYLEYMDELNAIIVTHETVNTLQLDDGVITTGTAVIDIRPREHVPVVVVASSTPQEV